MYEYKLFNIENGFFYVRRCVDLSDAITMAESIGYEVIVYKCGDDGSQLRIGTWDSTNGFADYAASVR